MSDRIRIDPARYSLDLGHTADGHWIFVAVDWGVGTPLVKAPDGAWIVLSPISQVIDHHAAFEEAAAQLSERLGDDTATTGAAK